MALLMRSSQQPHASQQQPTVSLLQQLLLDASGCGCWCCASAAASSSQPC
jgi:hypothetical protein